MEKKIKLILAAAALMILSAKAAHAGKLLVAEAPSNDSATPLTVSVSSTTLTKVPSSQTAGRMGFWLDAPNSNTGYLVGMQGGCTSAPAASTIRPIEINPDSDSAFMPLSDQQCLWLITTHTAAEDVHVQDVKQ